MADVIERIERELADAVAHFDPNGVPTKSLVTVYERLDRIERLAASAKTLLARRVDESREWQRQGHKTAAEFMAAKSGSTVGAASESLSTSNKLSDLPAVEQAIRDGELSQAQVNAIADAAHKDPRAQRRLIRKAKRSSLKELRDECGRTKAAADPDRDATHRRIHENRHVRTYTDSEGAWNLRARGTPDQGARVEAVLRPLIDEQFAKARTEGRHESRDAYAFDALVEALERPAASEIANNIRYLGLVRVDLEALRRGAASSDEYCEITGIGPIPVSVARALLGEAIVKLVITKGVDVLHVTHLGRGPSVAQKMALLWQQPLCTVEGCCRTRVEVDHRIEYRKTKHTRLEECDPLCKHHHDLKTYQGWALVEGTGTRPMVPPDDPRHPGAGKQ